MLIFKRVLLKRPSSYLHTCHHVPFENFVERNLGAAPVDNLVRDLTQKPCELLLRVIETRKGPNHADAVEKVREDFGDIFRLRLFDLLAGVG